MSVGTHKSSQNKLLNITDRDRDLKEKIESLICIAEFSNKEDLFYITIIKPFMNNVQYTIKSTEKKWKIKFSTILNDSPYCVAISQKKSNSIKAPILSKITFCKYPYETIVSQEVVGEEIIYCCYNPKNTIELIICGKGYLRLWDVFINEGAIKEHQQRFLRGKQEKDKTFIKAQFFTKKQFLLIAGTKENIFFIFEGFQCIHELNVCYSLENIYDLNIQNLNKVEEEDDITNLKESIDSIDKDNIDNKLREISNILTLNISNKSEKEKEKITENNKNNEEDELEESAIETKKAEEKMSEKEKIIQKLYKPKGDEEEDDKLVKNNGVKFFELINDNLLFVIYIKDGCSLFYKIDWNRKIQDDETETEFKKWKAAENRIIRIGKNIKTFHGFSMYNSSNDILLITESYEKNIKKGKTYISLLKLKKILIKEQKILLNSLHFECELFKGFFKDLVIKYIDLWEKKNILLILESNNNLYSFNINRNEYTQIYHFEEDVYGISVNPINNYFAVSFKNKVSIFGKLKNICETIINLDVSDSLVKWTFNGKYLIIAGKNRNTQKKENTNCLYVVDYLKYNTIKVIENIPYKITKLKFVDDRYIFCLLSDNIISGFFMEIADCSHSIFELYKKEEEHYILANKQFPRIFYHSNKTHHYTTFDYDSKLKLSIALEYSINKMHLLIQKKSKSSKNTIEDIEIKNCNLLKIRLLKELKILIGGDDTGSLNIYNWPFKDYDYKPNLNENLRTYINIEIEAIKSMINFKNYRYFITLFNNSTIFINELLVCKSGTYKPFEYFNKRMKPQMEIFFDIYNLYEMKKGDVFIKEENAKYLDEGIDKINKIMEEDLKDIQNAYNYECKNMKESITYSISEEEKKYNDIQEDLMSLKTKMGEDIKRRLIDLEKSKMEKEQKNTEKLNTIKKEIKYLKEDLIKIRKNIEDAYNSDAIVNQKKELEEMIKDYNQKFDVIKSETNESLLNLVRLTGEYDEATDTIVDDYKKLIESLDKRIKDTINSNNNVLKERQEVLLQEKYLEDEHKVKLEEKVKESDELIEKNVEIKQNIINATQRTITFQEQLLETEKNLIKIDKKLEDLLIKNKHLEQIRFVLEHRMSSLEKEKAPLEGQCTFLENQKNKLTEEFNKIILQINMNNQELENKQSQLRASLIQNYEAIDQKIYIEEKIALLKKDLDKFIDKHIKTNDNKATRTALDFRNFYIKFFSNSIDEELIEYQYYTQKLQEQKEKDGISNNDDLIMRNKAEEKLITEKKKVEELKLIKENGFRRLQNENTILINECNRLRKNLHEIYLHVIDIEQRFEKLTKIDPNLSKIQIVRQIKEFIKNTHEQIKENYSRKSNLNNYNKGLDASNNFMNQKVHNKRYITPLGQINKNRNRSTNNINASFFDNKKIVEVIGDEEFAVKEKDNNNNNINIIEKEEDDKKANYYENIIQKPKKLTRAESFIAPKKNVVNNNIGLSINIKRGKIKLPSISTKK